MERGSRKVSFHLSKATLSPLLIVKSRQQWTLLSPFTHTRWKWFPLSQVPLRMDLRPGNSFGPPAGNWICTKAPGSLAVFSPAFPPFVSFLFHWSYPLFSMNLEFLSISEALYLSLFTPTENAISWALESRPEPGCASQESGLLGQCLWFSNSKSPVTCTVHYIITSCQILLHKDIKGLRRRSAFEF